MQHPLVWLSISCSPVSSLWTRFTATRRYNINVEIPSNYSLQVCGDKWLHTTSGGYQRPPLAISRNFTSVWLKQSKQCPVETSRYIWQDRYFVAAGKVGAGLATSAYPDSFGKQWFRSVIVVVCSIRRTTQSPFWWLLTKVVTVSLPFLWALLAMQCYRPRHVSSMALPWPSLTTLTLPPDPRLICGIV